MDAQFWHDKWNKKEIGFHREKPHPLLTRYIHTLRMEPGSRVFIPLCGKSVDIAWLLSEGYKIIGVELSEIAIAELFESLKVHPEISPLGKLKKYHAEGIAIFAGDFFDLEANILAGVAGIYDRAALVALPSGMREKYAQRLADLTGFAPQLVITFEYDQSLMPGPPFAVDASAMQTLYGERYSLERLLAIGVKGGLREQIPAQEVVWGLRAKV